MTDYAIRAENVSKRFLMQRERRSSLKERFVRGKAPKAREFWALKNASFEIPRGQTFGIIGHNGSGKSTALKVLTGVYRPTSGSVEVNGRVSALLELGAGFHPELTGRENIKLNGSILGFSPRQIDSMMDEIIDFSGVEQFIDSPVKVYSSGMYVRLGFAIAVKVDPEILLVDEVIAVGDEQFQRKCFDYLHGLRSKGATIVMVSHGMGQVEEMCDQVVWLDHGEVRQIGPARDVVKSYIRQVNKDEVVGETPQDEGRVRGSGDITISDFSSRGLSTKSGQIVTGEPALFRIRYTSRVPLGDAAFQIELVNDSGIQVSVADTSWGQMPPLFEGEAELQLHIPRFPLNEGVYFVNVTVGSRGHVYFREEEVAKVVVESGDRQHGGIAALDGTWTCS